VKRELGVQRVLRCSGGLSLWEGVFLRSRACAVSRVIFPRPEGHGSAERVIVHTLPVVIITSPIQALAPIGARGTDSSIACGMFSSRTRGR
jgi:hypothetical protein